jgi:predicted DNA-binding protein YlxM (UPF0122 family)
MYQLRITCDFYKNKKGSCGVNPQLYFYHGLSEKEIAKAEGVSQQMVSLSLDGALKNLKKYLKL